MRLLFPVKLDLPVWLYLHLFSLVVSMIATHYLSRIFFDPIKKLNEGMQRVAEGDFSVRLNTDSTAIEIKEMFAGFNMMAKELGSTEILQTDFVSNVSHEFKTPINAIEGYTTLLQGCEELGAEEREYVEKILFNTGRLSSLVSNILLMSKLENQSIMPLKKRYSLDEQIRESIVLLEGEWEKKDIEFDVELDDCDYYGNESVMHHVWNNLIGNAVKFSSIGGLVKLRLYQEDGKTVFTVEDRGCGIPEGAEKHIFDKFYQADSSHKEAGNGLGLALVKKIVTAEGGSVEVCNVPEGGCKFTVILNNK